MALALGLALPVDADKAKQAFRQVNGADDPDRPKGVQKKLEQILVGGNALLGEPTKNRARRFQSWQGFSPLPAAATLAMLGVIALLWRARRRSFAERARQAALADTIQLPPNTTTVAGPSLPTSAKVGATSQ